MIQNYNGIKELCNLWTREPYLSKIILEPNNFGTRELKMIQNYIGTTYVTLEQDNHIDPQNFVTKEPNLSKVILEPQNLIQNDLKIT